jgi:hypothetical protein
MIRIGGPRFHAKILHPTWPEIIALALILLFALGAMAFPLPAAMHNAKWFIKQIL